MINLAHIKHNRTFYGLIAGNVLLLGLIGLFVIRPVVGLLVTHTREIGQVRGEVTAAQKKTEELRKLKDSYTFYEQTYAPILQGLPKEKDIAGFQTELDELSRQTGAVLDTFDVPQGQGGQPQNVGGFQAMPITINLTGTYATILDFTNRLETMSRITRVAGLDLRVENAGTGAMNATLQIQTLFLP